MQWFCFVFYFNILLSWWGEQIERERWIQSLDGGGVGSAAPMATTTSRLSISFPSQTWGHMAGHDPFSPIVTYLFTYLHSQHCVFFNTLQLEGGHLSSSSSSPPPTPLFALQLGVKCHGSPFPFLWVFYFILFYDFYKKIEIFEYW